MSWNDVHLSLAEQQSKIQTCFQPVQNAFLDILETLRQMQMAADAKGSEVDVLADKVAGLDVMRSKVDNLMTWHATNPLQKLEKKIEDRLKTVEAHEDRLQTLEAHAHGSLDSKDEHSELISSLKAEIESLSARLHETADQSQVPITRTTTGNDGTAMKELRAMEARVAEEIEQIKQGGNYLKQQLFDLERSMELDMGRMKENFNHYAIQQTVEEQFHVVDAKTSELNEVVEALRAMNDEQSAKLTALHVVFEKQGLDQISLQEKSREFNDALLVLQRRVHRACDGPQGIDGMVNDLVRFRDTLLNKADKAHVDTQRQDLEQSLKVIRSTMVRALGKFEHFIVQMSGTTAGQITEHDKLLSDLKNDVQQLVIQERIAQMSATTHCLSCFQDRSASPPANLMRGTAGFPSDQVDEHLVVLPKASPASIPKSIKGHHPKGMSPFHLQELEQGNVFSDSPLAQLSKGAQILAEATKNRPASAHRGRAVRPQSARRIAPPVQSKDSFAPADMRI